MGDMDNREAASLIWLAVFVVAVLSYRPARASLLDLPKALFTPIVIVSLALLFTYTGCLLWATHALNLWSWNSVPAIVIWFVTGALVLFFRLDRALKEPKYFRSVFVESVGLFLLVEFYLNLYPLPLLAELLLQGALAVLVLLSAAASLNREHRGLLTFLTVVQGLVILGVALYTAIRLIIEVPGLDWVELGKQLVLPVVLNLGLIPFLYGFALYAAYEGAFIGMRRFSSKGASVWPGRVALVSKAGLSIPRVHGLDPRAMVRMGQSVSIRDARGHYEQGVLDQKAAVEATLAAEERLVSLAGVDGDDSEGRRLDQREFKQTKAALEWLASCHMGHYRNLGKYRTDMISFLGSSLGIKHGLPHQHGVTVLVSEDGQSWWAWRTTISGWVFGVGACGAPPDEWKYDGQAVPAGPPNGEAGWRHFSEGDLGRNGW